MKRIIIFMISIFWLLSQNGYGSSGMAFLKIGAGARAAAMAEAYTAVANDATGLFWNPAGIVQAPTRQIVLSHNQWLNDVTHDFIGLVFPAKNSALGLSLILNNIDGLERRTIASETPIAEFSAHDLWAGISYARQIGSRTNIGLTAKYLYEKIYLETASGLAFDFGAQYQILDNSNLVFAAVIQNMGTTTALRQEKIQLPLTFRAGLAWRLPMVVPGKTLLSLDLMQVRSENTHINLGAEYTWRQRLAMRVGYQTGFEDKGLAAGFGLIFGFFNFHYAFVPFGAEFNHTHRFELGLKF